MPTTQSSDRVARVRRIKSRGCPEIIAALNHGALGIKSLEHITRLPTAEQALELARRLEHKRTMAARQAAWRADPRRGKAVFASQSYAEARARRLRRIQKRACAELKSAYEEGRLSLRAYDLLSRCSHPEQRKTIKSDRNKEQAQTQAALTIREMLAGKPQHIDLAVIAAKIITAIRGTSIRST
jgi:hypothetical protein